MSGVLQRRVHAAPGQARFERGELGEQASVMARRDHADAIEQRGEQRAAALKTPGAKPLFGGLALERDLAARRGEGRGLVKALRRLVAPAEVVIEAP